MRKAEDGEKALECLTTERPDCIVTDLRMPRLNGLEFRRMLKARHDTAAIPVIALTAMGAPAEIATARAAGFETILVKPCLPEHLAREVIRLVTLGRENPAVES